MEDHPRPGARKRAAAFAVSVSLLFVLFVAGLAYSNSIGAARVADNAFALHWANATLGTSALTRAGLVQAVTFAGLEQEGLATADDSAYAIEQVRDSYQELGELARVGGDHPPGSALSLYLRMVDAVATALDDGDLETARALVIGEAETAYVELVDSLQTEQETIQAAIDENTALASRLNSFVVFFMILAVPISAVLVYWWMARRQVREYRMRTELELEAERAISRAKDEFIAGLSHELRTPLTSIYGFAEMMAQDGVDGMEQAQETAHVIAKEAAEMARMVDDLLAASRLESTGLEIEMSPTSVDDIVEAAMVPFERAGMVIKREPSNVTISTDAARLRHVLTNLFSNAARHGGPRVGVEVVAGEGSVDIRVWDDGPGIAEDQLEGLFDKFVHDGAASLLTGSVGLGLAVASRITHSLGGRLRYQRLGDKTHFIVSLPMTDSVATPVSDESSVDEMPRARSA